MVPSSFPSARSIPGRVALKLQGVTPISPSAVRIINCLSEEANFRTVANWVAADPVLAATVLRLVNSPLFGMRQPVTSILQAIALVGFDRLRALVTTVALRALVAPGLKSPGLKRCWRHAVACGCVSMELANQTGIEPNTAYTAGLLHSAGSFALFGCWPKEYEEVLNVASPDDLLEREVQRLGVDHAEAGAYLLDLWRLPADLTAVARHHHSARNGEAAGLVDLVSAACVVASDMGFRMTTNPNQCGSEPSIWPPGDPEKLLFRVADSINQIEQL